MHKIIFLFFLFFSLNLFSVDLSYGYNEYKLNSSQLEIKKLLSKSFEFDNRREEVLSIRLEPDTEIITAEGISFIKIGYFHFYKDKLFQIFLKLNEKDINYYLLLKQLSEKYGPPKKFEPKRAIWEDNKTRIVIEKPCSIKYIEINLWNEIIKNENINPNYLKEIRDDFLKKL